MKWIVALLLAALVLAPAGARAEGPDDQYVGIYSLIEQGDSLKSSAPAALAKYKQAQTALLRLQRTYPDWNPRIINYRLSYLTAQAASLGERSAPPTAFILTNRPLTRPAPKPAPPEQPEKPVSGELENQINTLRGQVQTLQSDMALLSAKLKEALAAQPAAVDPRELAKAQQRITSLEKENDLLKVTVIEAKAKAAAPSDAKLLADTQQALAEANRKLEEQTQKTSALAKEKEFLANKLALLTPSADNAAALASTRKALDDANRQLAQQKQASSKFTSDREALEARVKSLTTESEAAAALRAENELLRKQLAQAKASTPAPDKNADAARELSQAKVQLAALESDREILRLEKEALSNRVSQLTVQAAGATVPPKVVTNTVVLTNTMVLTNTVVVTNTVTAPRTEDAAKLKALQRERDEAQKNFEAATKELDNRRDQAGVAHVTELENQLVTLHARLDIFETTQVPYTAEELALMSKLAPKLADTNSPTIQAPVKPSPAVVSLLSQAQRYFANHQLEEAEAAYTQVLQQGQTNVFTLANLATVQLEHNRLEAAETNLLQALAMAPNDAYSLSILGYLRYRQQRYDEAMDALSRAAKLDPQNAQVQNYLGIVLAEKGLRGPAETAFRKAIQLDPNYADAHNNLAVIYISQQPPAVELARWHYQRALAAGRPHDPFLEKKLEIKQ